jgi:DNA-binding transcriptional ArsR family regulator
MWYYYHMSSQPATTLERAADDQDVWRALSNPLRRGLLDLLREGPSTTGELVAAVPGLSRFAVMQHLEVLVDAGLVVVSRRGRHRFNHLNPVPLRTWYERWVDPLADMTATEALSLQRHIEGKVGKLMDDQVRTVRIEAELRFKTTPDRLFKAFTDETLEWFPHTYGEDRVQGIVVEPRVGGAHYEDWGDGMGYLYGYVTVYDRPHQLSTRGRIMPGTVLDSTYSFEPNGDETVLKMSKVAVGPMTEEEANSIRTFGDVSRFEDAIRALVEQP